MWLWTFKCYDVKKKFQPKTKSWIPLVPHLALYDLIYLKKIVASYPNDFEIINYFLGLNFCNNYNLSLVTKGDTLQLIIRLLGVHTQ